MCGRYLITSPVEALRALFGFAGPAVNLAPRWNAAPTQTLPIVRREGAEKRLAMLRWGLVPSWSKDIGRGAPLINARSESVAEKPAFRDAFRRRRCLVPADGFYEWPTTGDAKTRGKTPVLFTLASKQPFAFAGLWESWRGPDGVVESFTILSTAANELMARYHHRFPVVLGASDHDRWLDPAVDATEMLRPPPSSWFVVTQVTMHVNAVKNDDPTCVVPAAQAPAVPTPGQGRLF